MWKSTVMLVLQVVMIAAPALGQQTINNARSANDQQNVNNQVTNNPTFTNVPPFTNTPIQENQQTNTQTNTQNQAQSQSQTQAQDQHQTQAQQSINKNTNQNANVNENVLANTSSQDVTTAPVQSITIEGSTNLPQVPGFTPAYPNFTQPFKPDFLNGRKFVIDEMTVRQAEECRDGKVKWYGGDRKSVDRIRLFYDPQNPPVPMAIDSYVGTAVASGKDIPFTPVLCEAAYRAMRQGVTHAFVAWVIRPENKTSGIGFGASAGFSGLPAAGANPYAVAAIAGFGTGMSSVRVQGELMIELTGFGQAMTAMTSGKPVASAPGPQAPPSVAQARPEAPAQSEVEIVSDGWRGGAYDPAEGTNFGR